MKLILLIPLPILLAACATRHAPVVKMSPYAVPGTTLPSEGIESVRYAENIKAYPLGRYVDPNNSRIMHEAHSIYRVETTAKWNLHPNAPVSVPLGPVRVRDTAKTTSPVGNELVAELNQQKEATKAVMQGGQVVSQKLGELAKASADAADRGAKRPAKTGSRYHQTAARCAGGTTAREAINRDTQATTGAI